MFFIVNKKRVTFLLCALNNPSCARTKQFKIRPKLQKKFKGNVKKKYSDNQKQWNSKTLGNNT